MQVKVIKATIDQKPLLANLLELYTYDFTESCDFDVGDDGLYGYKYLPLYWVELTRFPYIIHVNQKIAGFILLQKGSPISDNTMVWDISEFFVMKKYKRHGVGTIAALKIWEQFQGPWQVRVLVRNHIACLFWLQTIKKFISISPVKTELTIKGEDWIIYSFESNDRTARVVQQFVCKLVALGLFDFSTSVSC
jgi:predicted acetyltransferase